MLSPRGAGAGAWSGRPRSRGRMAPGLLRGEKAPEEQGCCEPWGPCLGNRTQQGGCPPDSPRHSWQGQGCRPCWGAGHRGSRGKDPVPRALRPLSWWDWRGRLAWRLRRVPGSTGAGAPGAAGETDPAVPCGPGPGFESQPHAPTWKAMGPPPPTGPPVSGGRQPSLPSWGRTGPHLVGLRIPHFQEGLGQTGPQGGGPLAP